MADDQLPTEVVGDEGLPAIPSQKIGDEGTSFHMEGIAPPLAQQTEARANDYSWPDIDAHIAQYHDTAAQFGYSDQQASQQLGYLPSGPTQARLTGRAQNALNRTSIIGGHEAPIPGTNAERDDPLNNPPQALQNASDGLFSVNTGPDRPGKEQFNVGNLPDYLREDYSKAMLSGQVKSAQDFAHLVALSYGSATGMDLTSTESNVAAQLISPRDPIDYGIALTQGRDPGPIEKGIPPAAVDPNTGLPINPGPEFNLEMAKATASNLTKFWAETGMDPHQAYTAAQKNPLLYDALTAPTLTDLVAARQQPAWEPPKDVPGTSLAELNAPLRDQVEADYTPEKALTFMLPIGLGGALGLRAAGLIGKEAASTAMKEMGGAAFGAFEGGHIFSQKTWQDGLGAVAEDTANIYATAKLGQYVVLPLINKVMRDGPGLAADATFELQRLFKSEAGYGQVSRARAAEQARIQYAKVNPKVPVGGLGWEETRGDFTPFEDRIYQKELNEKQLASDYYMTSAAMKPEWREDAFQQKAFRQIQEFLKAPKKSPLDPDVQEYFNHMEYHLDNDDLVRQELDDRLPKDSPYKQGTVRSWRDGFVYHMYDNQPGGTRPVQRNAGTSLTGIPFGADNDEHYVIQGSGGRRTWGSQPLTNVGNGNLRIGDKFTGPNGSKYTVMPATTDEIAKNTGLPISDNHALTFMEMSARNHRLLEGTKLVKEGQKALKAQGLWISMADAAKMKYVPEGMAPVHGVAPFDGYAYPRTAETLNNLNQSSDRVDQLFEKLGRVQLQAMFLDPIFHGNNVSAQAILGRGTDWLKPSGWGNLVKYGAQAFQELVTRGPLYQQFLQAGNSSWLLGNDQRNFWNLIQHKTLEELNHSEMWHALFDANGIRKPIDVFKAVYHNSEGIIAMWNDTLKFSRWLELRAKGLPDTEARFQAEKDAINYRMPSMLAQHVFGDKAGATASKFWQKKSIDWFGNYHYGEMRSLSLMVNDTMRGQKFGSYNEKVEAFAKIAMLALGSIAIIPALNYGATNAWHGVGGKGEVHLPNPGLFGMVSATGIPGLIQSHIPVLKDMPQSSAPGHIMFGVLNRLLELSGPLRFIADMTGYNPQSDVLGISDYNTPVGKAVKLAEAGANLTYPTQILTELGQKNGVAKAVAKILGGSIRPDAADQAKYEKWDISRAMSAERHDANETAVLNFAHWLHMNIGGPPPAITRHSGNRSSATEPGVDMYGNRGGGGGNRESSGSGVDMYGNRR